MRFTMIDADVAAVSRFAASTPDEIDALGAMNVKGEMSFDLMRES